MDSQDLISQYQTGKRDFSQSHLAHTILSGQILRNIDFTNANLDGSDLSGSDLRKAVLHYANLTGANLQNANLRRSFLAGADFSRANLCGANLSQAVFEDSDHELLILQDAVYDELTQFPDGVDPRSLGALLAEEITIEANGELEPQINSIDDSDSHASNQQDIEAPLPTPLSNKRDTKELPASPTGKPLLSSPAPSSANDPTRKSIFVLLLLPIIFIFGLGGFFALSYIYPVQEQSIKNQLELEAQRRKVEQALQDLQEAKRRAEQDPQPFDSPKPLRSPTDPPTSSPDSSAAKIPELGLSSPSQTSRESSEADMSNATISGELEQKNIRSGPGTVYKILHTADPGDRVKIISSSSDSGGYLWYKVNLLKSGVQGWIAAQLVVVDSPSNLEAANSEVNPTPLSPESSTREVSKVAHQGYCTFLATDSQGNMINNQCIIYDQNDGTYQLKWSDGFLTTIAVTPNVEIDGVPASIVQQSSTSLTVSGPKGKIGFCWSCQP